MHHFMKLLCASVLLLTGTLSFAQPTTKALYVAGVDYFVLANPSKVEVPGKIVVREFFWYGCPHCYRLEPYVDKWRKSAARDVVFILAPAALNPVWEQNARAYYAADMMGVAQKTHAALFIQIHEKQQRLFDQSSLANFYAQYGADPKKFNNLFNSFAVSGKITQSLNLAKQYQIDGVPCLVIQGKYLVKGEDGRALDVVNYLVARERALLRK